MKDLKFVFILSLKNVASGYTLCNSYLVLIFKNTYGGVFYSQSIPEMFPRCLKDSFFANLNSV